MRSPLVRLLATILGAVWFFPVSCTSGMVLGTPLISKFNERHMERGETPHRHLFRVVWQPGEAGKPFGISRLEDLPRIKALEPARSFIMEQPSGGEVGGAYTVISAKTLSSGEREQLIEVRYADDTYDSWSRYRATRSEVTPVFSKIMDPGFMIMSLPIGLGFAGALFALGKLLRRRVARFDAQGDARSPAAPVVIDAPMKDR